MPAQKGVSTTFEEETPPWAARSSASSIPEAAPVDESLSFAVIFVILSCNGLFEEARLFCPDSLEMRAPDETA